MGRTGIGQSRTEEATAAAAHRPLATRDGDSEPQAAGRAQRLGVGSPAVGFESGVFWCLGRRLALGKKVEVQKPNQVSAKCAIELRAGNWRVVGIDIKFGAVLRSAHRDQ
jgi:hypothetical protein